MATILNVCSFNCKNIKTSVTELNDLCTNYDFVLLQETWLSRPELPMLSPINSALTGYGLSSMDEESQIFSGRPFGGIAILWRKCFNAYCSIKLYDCDRIIGIEYAYDSFKALFLCVYLPYDCAENFDDYMFYLSQLLQIIEDFSSPYVYICGDLMLMFCYIPDLLINYGVCVLILYYVYLTGYFYHLILLLLLALVMIQCRG